MSDEIVSQVPAIFSSKERAALVARALSEAARRARFSTKRRQSLTTGSLRERRGAQLLRLFKICSFIGIVAVPSLLYAGYITRIASSQYTAEARFTVRGGLPTSIDQIGKSTGAPNLLIIQDTQVILNFMQSRAMVESLNKAVDYESLFEEPSIDWLSRLKPNQAIEQVLKYWKKHIAVSVQMPSGIVVFTVRAFSPDEAVRISHAALDASELLVNQMNDKMRTDAVALADTERKRAAANMATTRANLERARNEEGILSATDESKGVNTLIEQVQAQTLKLQQEYDSQRRYVRADAPQLKNLQTKIDASDKEVEALRARLTRSGPTTGKGGKSVLSGSMSRLDLANLENSIAEKIYATSLSALEQARLAGESKLMYLNAFVEPVAAEQAEYPKRGLDLSIFVLAAISAWIVIVGGLLLARNSFR